MVNGAPYRPDVDVAKHENDCWVKICFSCQALPDIFMYSTNFEISIAFDLLWEISDRYRLRLPKSLLEDKIYTLAFKC